MTATTTDRPLGFRAHRRDHALARLSLVLAVLGFVFDVVRPTRSGTKPHIPPARFLILGAPE